MFIRGHFFHPLVPWQIANLPFSVLGSKNGFGAAVSKTRRIVVEKISPATSSVKKPSPPPLKPQMSKNVLSIMELDEMDDDEADGDGIDGVEKVVGMAATPPQNNGTLTTSLFEVNLHKDNMA